MAQFKTNYTCFPLRIVIHDLQLCFTDTKMAPKPQLDSAPHLGMSSCITATPTNITLTQGFNTFFFPLSLSFSLCDLRRGFCWTKAHAALIFHCGSDRWNFRIRPLGPSGTQRHRSQVVRSVMRGWTPYEMSIQVVGLNLCSTAQSINNTSSFHNVIANSQF